MGKDKWDGMGERLRQAIKDRGFINSKGDADITRFALTHGWLANYLYRWTNNAATPDKANLLKLGAILRMSPAELLGDEVSKVPTNPRKRGGKALVWLLAALGLGTIGWGPTPVQANFAALGSEPTAAGRDSVKYRRRGYSRWGRAFPDPLLSGFHLLTVCAA